MADVVDRSQIVVGAIVTMRWNTRKRIVAVLDDVVELVDLVGIPASGGTQWLRGDEDIWRVENLVRCAAHVTPPAGSEET